MMLCLGGTIIGYLDCFRINLQGYDTENTGLSMLWICFPKPSLCVLS